MKRIMNGVRTTKEASLGADTHAEPHGADTEFRWLCQRMAIEVKVFCG